MEADTSAVFLADLQTVSGIPKVQQLWRATTNAPAEYIDKHIAKGLTVSVSCTMQAKIKCEGEFSVWCRCSRLVSQVGLPLSGEQLLVSSSQYSAFSR